MPSTPPPGDPAPADGGLPASATQDLRQRGLSLYLHVPFCSTRCGYCDFNTYTAAELGSAPGAGQDAYLEAVVAELDLAVRVLGTALPVRTIFFGGGTPTLLPAPALAGLLERIGERFAIDPDAEITTEANPESVDREYLNVLVAAGFTRLSLGMQSATPKVLQVLERRHTPGRVGQVVGWAREAGFGAISLDLIYGSPGETEAEWRTSLATALDLHPDHLSAYSLIVEPGTRLAARIARGEMVGTDEDRQADFYLIAEEVLGQAGYSAYEISNWAKPGQECRHNLAYWLGADWWGIGPGAHSHIGGVRWWNVRRPIDYSRRLHSEESPAQAREMLTVQDARVERVMLELRLATGLELAVLTASELARTRALVASGLAVRTADRLVLTLQGRLLADAVIRDLLD